MDLGRSDFCLRNSEAWIGGLRWPAPLAGCTGRVYRKGFCCKVFRLHHKPLSLDRLLVTMVQSLIKVFLFLVLPSHLWAQPSSECPRVTKEHTNCLDRLIILNFKLQYLPSPLAEPTRTTRQQWRPARMENLTSTRGRPATTSRVLLRSYSPSFL